MALAFGYTPGGNKYPTTDSDYVQAAFWKAVAEGRDTLDSELVTAAVNALLGRNDFLRYRGEIPPGTDVNSMRTMASAGIWYTGNATNMENMLNLYDKWPSIFVVLPGPSSLVAAQIQIPYASHNAFAYRPTASINGWMPWNDLAAPPSSGAIDVFSGHYGTPNVDLIEDFKVDYPLHSTGNKGAVMLRFDHNLTSFKAKILPHLQAHNFKYCLALNSRKWSDPLNSGMTQAEVKAEIAAGRCEPWNHHATHLDSTDPATLWDNIVNGKLELEAQLGVKIHGWIMPGAAPTGLGGLGGGSSLADYSKTYAGSVIMANHAVFSGAIGGTSQRKLDGRIKQCQFHYTIDKRTVAEIKAQIDLAIANKTALQLMLHPNVVGTTDSPTEADLVEVFDYMQAKVTSGELEVLSPYQSLHATL